VAAENFKVKKGLEVGTGITANSDGINVSGIVTATQFRGDGSGLTGVVASGTGIVIKEEGNAVGTAGTINFVGSNILATLSDGTATITVDNSTLSSLNVTGIVTATTGDFVDIDVDGTAELDDVVIAGVTTMTGNLTLSSAFPKIIITDTNNDSDYEIANANGLFRFRDTTNSTDRLTINSDGKVYINKDLDVDGRADLDDVVVAGVSTFNANVDVKAELTANKLILDDDGSSSPTLTIAGDDENVFGMVLVNDTYKSSPAAGFKHTQLNNGEIQVLLRANNSATRLPYKIQQGNAPTGLWDSFTIDADGAVKLGFGGNQKLTTTANGIEVPDLNVTGVGTVGRLDTNGVTLGTNNNTFAAKFVDNAVANFGDDNDLKIFHDSNNSIIDNNTGDLIIRGDSDDVKILAEDDIVLRDNDDNTNFIHCINGGAVELYHNGTKKFETSGSGVIVTGVCTATSFSGSGAGLTSIPSAQLTGALPSLDGSALTGVTASGTGIVIQHDGSNVGTAGTINFSTNLDVSPVFAGIVTVTASGGGGGSQNLFSTIAVSGQNNIVADATTDTLTFAEGENITLTTDNSTDTLTITGITTEKVQDIVGAMFSSNTETDVTATYQDADGTIDLVVDLSSLNADNLDSGIIPNGRFPATLPATSGANLTALNASEITSGTLPIARIADNSVSADKLAHTTVTAGSYTNTDITVDAQGRITSASSGSAGITTAPSNVQVTLNLTSSGSNYRLTGPGQDGTENNPDLYLVRGQRYRITHNAGGAHPLQIRLSDGGTAYTDGVTYSNTGNNTTTNGNNLEINLQHDAPARLYYQCTVHGSMLGNIFVVGGPQEIVGVLTATTFSGSGASLTNLPAGQLTGTVADARISTLTASKLTGALPAISGANLTNLPSDTPSNSDIQVAYTVTANGTSAYRFAGNGVVSTADNPDLYLIRGQKYRFINNSGGSHPFQIRASSGGSAYSTGVTNNGASSGNIDFAPTYDSPAQLVYQCTNHGGMVGNIYIFGASGNNKNVGVTTFSGAVTATSFSGSGANLTGLTASQIPNLAASKITSGTFNVARIPTLNQDTTGNAAGLSGTPDISVNNIVGAAATFSGITTVTGTTLFAKQLSVAGVVTATKFVGSAVDLTGFPTLNQNTTGTAGGLTGSPNITVGNAVITGDLTVQGTTTSQNAEDTTVSGILTATEVKIGIPATGIGATFNASGADIVGIVTATSFKKTGGTSNEFLKADGSVDTNTYLTSETSHSDVLVDGDFTSQGFMVRGASAGSYSIDSNTYQTSLTFGISNTNAVKIDSTSVADDEYARFTASGLESRSTSEVLSDIGAQAALTFGISNTNVVKIDSTSVADDEYARFTASGLESRSTSEVLSDIGAQAALTFSTGITNSSGTVTVDSAVQTSVAGSGSNTNAFVIDTIALNSFKLLEYTIHITHSSGIQAQKLLVMCDGTSGSDNHTEFAVMFSSSLLGAFTTSTNGSNVEVKFDPVNTSTTVKYIKQMVA